MQVLLGTSVLIAEVGPETSAAFQEVLLLLFVLLRPVTTARRDLSHLSPCLIGAVPHQRLQYSGSQHRQELKLFSPVS